MDKLRFVLVFKLYYSSVMKEIQMILYCSILKSASNWLLLNIGIASTVLMFFGLNCILTFQKEEKVRKIIINSKMTITGSI